jgi:electron transfer flavoprotein beta subunit
MSDMRIVVPVKYAPDPTSPWAYAPDGTVDRDAVDARLSELDEYAVEQAVRVVEAGAEATITFLTMGPAGATDALRKALAMGGDDGVHVLDDQLRGSDAVATSLVLATAIERIGFDLVVCGMASTDGEMSVVPAMLAERLGVRQATLARSLSLADGAVRIGRDDATETQDVLAELPAVVSVTDRTGEARYPSFKAILASKKKPIATWSLADLGLEPTRVGTRGSACVVRSASAQPPRTAGQVVVDEGDGAARIADFLSAQRLL